MKINTVPKLIAAMLGILAGLYFPEILAFLKSLFAG